MSDLSQRVEALERLVAELSQEQERGYRSTWRYKEGVVTGNNVRIHPTCTIIATQGRTVDIGDGVLLRRGAEIVGPVTIGAGSSFNRDAYIRANVHIGKRCNIGAFARFISDSHEIGGTQRRAGKGSFPSIHVGDGTWIGAGSTILGGVTIGESCIVAAGAVVTQDVPANTMVGGVPAKVMRHLDRPTTAITVAKTPAKTPAESSAQHRSLRRRVRTRFRQMVSK